MIRMETEMEMGMVVMVLQPMSVSVRTKRTEKSRVSLRKISIVVIMMLLDMVLWML